MNRNQRTAKVPRTIIHIDMDAFFAAIEQLDNPALRGKPVVVGADPQEGDGRGVVSTCSYEARQYGIHSAMPISQAYKRCPDAIFLPVRGARYKEISNKIMLQKIKVTINRLGKSTHSEKIRMI